MAGKIKAAVVGLGFAAKFSPICPGYPGTEMRVSCRRNGKKLPRGFARPNVDTLGDGWP